jgi:hypothetical protein
MRTLVVGWFSFPGMGATAGDLLARDVVCEWLEDAGRPYDVALAPPFEDGVDWQAVDPGDYEDLVFVCGPFGNGWPITDLLSRFTEARLVGVDLSMLQPLEEWNPFDVLLERDSSRTARPDISFLSKAPSVPVVGLVLVHRQSEYADGVHEEVEAAIHEALAARDVAVVPIDTRLDVNATGLHTPAQVESVIARMDVVVTTRLHGLVLALKNGIPAIAVDPVRGGAKVMRQADVLGWPHVVSADAATPAQIGNSLDRCLESGARGVALQCAQRARQTLEGVVSEFGAALGDV